MFLLEFYSLLSTLSIPEGAETSLPPPPPPRDEGGEGGRVDPLEGESAPRYWTVSSSSALA